MFCIEICGTLPEPTCVYKSPAELLAPITFILPENIAVLLLSNVKAREFVAFDAVKNFKCESLVAPDV